jgi:hypothetical protein
MLAAYFLRPHSHEEKPAGAILKQYTRIVTWSVQHYFATVCAGLVIFGVGALVGSQSANLTQLLRLDPTLSQGVWPFVKLRREYGLVAMISFLVLYLVGIIGNSNLALKVTLTIVYFFTGGYLLSPAMDNLVILLCFILTPNKEFANQSSGPYASTGKALQWDQDVARKHERSQSAVPPTAPWCSPRAAATPQRQRS